MAAAAEVRTGSQVDYEARRYYDTATWLAEVLPGQMRTPFEYTFDGYELYASDGGSMGEIFDDSIARAKNLPDYELRRRHIEKAEYDDMLSMMRGNLPNTMVVVSDFPPELMNIKEDQGGYNAERKQTMLRVLVRTPDNKLQMYSQSLDHSNRTALEAIYGHLGKQAEPGELLGQRINLELDEYEHQFLIDELVGVYDRSMAAQFGGDWYAGQANGLRVNTYDFVCSQADLLNAHLNGGGDEYNLAAAMLARWQSASESPDIAERSYDYDSSFGMGITSQIMAMNEMADAGSAARASGMTFSGCGMTMGSPERSGAMMSLFGQLDEAGYGNKLEEYVGSDKYGSLQFKCKRGHTNKRPRNKLLERCKVCKCSVRC